MGTDYTLTQVAGYKGLRIWHCPVLPPRAFNGRSTCSSARTIWSGSSSSPTSTARSGDGRAGRNSDRPTPNLLSINIINGDRTTHLADRLRAIELDFDEDLPLVTLLDRMRDAFDREAETASVAAARLMGTLYTHLESAGVGEHDATLLLARLLFLFFGDDADMWRPTALIRKSPAQPNHSRHASHRSHQALRCAQHPERIAGPSKLAIRLRFSATSTVDCSRTRCGCPRCRPSSATRFLKRAASTGR